MPRRVYRSEPFSANTAAIAAVQKNWSLAVHGAADSMIEELRTVQAASDAWAAARKEAWSAELERQASQVVEETVVEEEDCDDVPRSAIKEAFLAGFRRGKQKPPRTTAS